MVDVVVGVAVDVVVAVVGFLRGSYI